MLRAKQVCFHFFPKQKHLNNLCWGRSRVIFTFFWMGKPIFSSIWAAESDFSPTKEKHGITQPSVHKAYKRKIFWKCWLIIFVGDHLCRWRWTKWCKFDNDSNDDEYDQDNDHNEDDKIMIKMIKMTTKMKKIMSNRRQVCAVPQGSAGDRWGDHMM